jgi:hypothetical protein
MSSNINWDEVLDKKRRGSRSSGKCGRYSKGKLDNDKFYLTKRPVDRFDGLYLWFNITETEAQEFRRD